MPLAVHRLTLRTALLVLTGLACLALAACGDDDDAEGGARSAVAEQDAYPVTIRSKYGSATIDDRPVRVVALDSQAADDALALGVAPIAMAELTYIAGGVQSWTKDALKGRKPQLINIDNGVPYERVAALRPDLILATNTFQLEDKSVYDRLSRIAPTMHFVQGSGIDTWQQVMGRVGQALGQPDRARELVAQAERDLEAARARTPAFEGKTVNLFNADPSDFVAISSTSDFSIRFLSELGLRLSPRIEKLDGRGGYEGRAALSPERYELLESDLLMGTSPASKELAAVENSTLFKRLDAVREGRYLSLPIGPATSMAFPSLLSVRYATANVVPKLAAAIDGRSPDAVAE